MKKAISFLFALATSFTIFSQTATKTQLDWQIYTDSVSGFSISVPEKPTVKRQEIPAPELEGAVMQQKMAFASDGDVNYIVMVSDMPLGYFVEDKQEAFNSVLERIATQGSDFSEAKTITTDGVEGRYFTGLLRDMYYVRSWYFIRGNRAYYFLQQNLNTAPITDDGFIESLEFTPLKPAVLVPDTIDNYVLKHFGKFNIAEGETYSFVTKTTNLTAQNPYSGGSYLAEVNELSPYFNVLSLDTFYSKYMDAQVNWTDSLVSVEPIEIDGKIGREAWIYSWVNKSTSRLRFWIDNNNLTTIYAFCADEEYKSQTQETFFNSFKRLPNSPVFDIYSSKAKMLLADLASTDTVTQKAAFEALDYYEFDTTEVPLLHAALQKSWPDDSVATGIRGQLIEHIAYFELPTSIPVLTTLYKDEAVQNHLRNSALVAIQNLGEDGATTYAELFLNTPPKETQYYYEYFSPFYDSLDFGATHFERMLPLLADKTLGAGVLDMADRLMTEDSAMYYPLVSAAMPQLTANAIAEATMQRDSSGADSYYYYSATLTQLFNVLGHFAGYPVIDPFTTILMDTIIESYTVVEAINLRLKSKLTVPKLALEYCLNNKYSSYQTMVICYETGNEKLIPKTFKNAEAVAKAMFIEYFGYEDDYPDDVKIVGTLMVNGQTYYAVKALYEWDDNLNYFGVCGPIDKKNPLAALKTAKCNSDWDETKSDWKAQAELLIAALPEEGWPYEE